MTAQLAVGILTTIRSVLAYFQARQTGGDRDAALALLTRGNLEAAGLDEDAIEAALIARAGLVYLDKRGVPVQQSVDLIAAAEAEGRDVTTEEVQAALDQTQAELDETQDAIDNMEE